jgi:hypothetical protein
VATDAYRDCYAACRAEGGTIQACMERCQGLMPGDTCDPCCGLWACFIEGLPQTIEDVTGGIQHYILQPVQGTAWAVAAAAAALVVLILLVR